MTDNNHPITPPPELVEKWADIWHQAKVKHVTECEFVATQAARWGADQELEACCEYISRWFATPEYRAAELRSARRPKPPSLKEQAKQALGRFFANEHTQASQMTRDFEIIRRAVESLPD